VRGANGDSLGEVGENSPRFANMGAICSAGMGRLAFGQKSCTRTICMEYILLDRRVNILSALLTQICSPHHDVHISS